MTDPDLADFEAITEAAELRKIIRKLEQRLSQARAKTGELVEAVYQGAKDAALANPPAIHRPKPDRRTKREEAAVLVLSDWHIGKRTSSFDTDVARDRVRLLGDKIVKLTEIERADHPVRDAHALLTGDFVDNTNIFPGHAWEVDSTSFQQLFAAASILEGLLRTLLGTFSTVHVWQQAGNHGRIGRKGDYPRTDNLDLLLYRLVRDRLRGFEGLARLVWHDTQGWYSIVEVGAYRAMQIHGDQIKSFGGNTPAFGILRKANAWASGVVEPFSDLYLGHFHQALGLPMANGRGRVFVNPSIESDSQYAREFVASTGTPGQRLNFVEPVKGRVTSERIVWVDEP